MGRASNWNQNQAFFLANLQVTDRHSGVIRVVHQCGERMLRAAMAKCCPNKVILVKKIFKGMTKM